MKEEERSHGQLLLQAVVNILGVFALLVLTIVPLGLFTAWVAQQMYEWFLMPLGLPGLNLWHVYGILLLINLIKPRGKTDGKGEILKTVVINIFGGLLVLAVGAVLKGFI